MDDVGRSQRDSARFTLNRDYPSIATNEDLSELVRYKIAPNTIEDSGKIFLAGF